MTEKTLRQIREGILEQYKKEFPDEKLYCKVFSVYILDRYAKLLYRLYKKAQK